MSCLIKKYLRDCNCTGVRTEYFYVQFWTLLRCCTTHFRQNFSTIFITDKRNAVHCRKFIFGCKCDFYNKTLNVLCMCLILNILISNFQLVQFLFFTLVQIIIFHSYFYTFISHTCFSGKVKNSFSKAKRCLERASTEFQTYV